MTADTSDLPKLPPAQYCIDCHKPQGKHWGQTAHSLAFLTLIRAKEQNNLACIKCHSLALANPRGFDRASEIIEMSPETQGSINTMKERYWKKFLTSPLLSL